MAGLTRPVTDPGEATGSGQTCPNKSLEGQSLHFSVGDTIATFLTLSQSIIVNHLLHFKSLLW